MPQIHTNLRTTRESARQLRFEPTGPVTQTDVQKAIEQVSTTPQAISATSIAVADSPYTVPASVSVLYVDSSGGAVTVNLSLAAARLGVPLVIKDIGGAASSNNITINRAGAETIDSLTAITLSADYGGVRLNPRTGVGYTVSP
jgi:hypothetical protein